MSEEKEKNRRGTHARSTHVGFHEQLGDEATIMRVVCISFTATYTREETLCTFDHQPAR